MPGVLSAFPYSRFARIPGPDARLMTQSLRSEGISASRTSPSKLSSHPESVQFSRTSPSKLSSHPESVQFSRTSPSKLSSHPESFQFSRTSPSNPFSHPESAQFFRTAPSVSGACHDLVAPPGRRGLEINEGMTIGRDFDV